MGWQITTISLWICFLHVSRGVAYDTSYDTSGDHEVEERARASYLILSHPNLRHHLEDATLSKAFSPRFARDPITNDWVLRGYGLAKVPSKSVQTRYLEAAQVYNRGVQIAAKTTHADTDNDVTLTAVAHFFEAASICPEMSSPWNNLGVFATRFGFHDAAITYNERAVALEASALNRNNLGHLYYTAGKCREALWELRHISHACEVRSVFETIQCERQLNKRKRNDTFADQVVACLARKPMAPYVLDAFDLLTERSRGDALPDAVERFKKLVNFHLDEEDALVNLFHVFYHRLMFDAALAVSEAALPRYPNNVELLHGAAAATSATWHPAEASQLYRRLLTIDTSRYPQVRDTATVEVVNHDQLLCLWNTWHLNFHRLHSLVMGQVQHGQHPSQIPFSALGYDYTAAELRDIASATVLNLCRDVSIELPRSQGTFLAAKSVGDTRELPRLRIGIMTGDAGDTNVGRDMIGWFRYAKKLFSTTLQLSVIHLRTHPDDPWTQVIDDAADSVVDLPVNAKAADAARILHRKNFDVVINLNGFSKYHRNDVLCHHEAIAPITVNYKGTAMSYGNGTVMQYIIGDTCVIPPSLSPYYSEHIIHMPGSFFLTSYPDVWPDTLTQSPQRPAPWMAAGRPPPVVYCNFNHLNKVNPWTFQTWMNILRRVPNSVLWLLKLSKAAEPYLRSEAAAAGVRGDRLYITDLFPIKDHMIEKKRCDVFLDTDIFNAHGTATDVLWSGVPIITLPGTPYHSRVASCHVRSILTDSAHRNAALNMLIAKSWIDYEENAVALGRNHTMRKEIREAIKEGRLHSDVFNTAAWVRDFADAMLLTARLKKQNLPNMHITALPRKPHPISTAQIVKDSLSAPIADDE